LFLWRWKVIKDWEHRKDLRQTKNKDE